MGFGQTGIIKTDSLNLCILQVDYNTLEFKGGNINYYKKYNKSDTLPFIIDFHPPNDFGGITFKIRTTLDTIFNATFEWMGTGKLKYPNSFTYNSPFDTIKEVIPKPNNLEYFDIKGRKVFNDTLFMQKADSAWETIKSLSITNKFAEFKFKTGIFLFAPKSFHYGEAKWFIFLFYSENGNQLNNYSIRNHSTEVYPNPIVDLLNINSKQNFNYKIFDSIGNLVKSGELNDKQIDLGNLLPGIYNIRLTNEFETINRQIIKINNR
jgi:hypothetical protein